YGVVDPELARAMVNEQVVTAVTARLQRELEAVEDEEARLRFELESLLGHHGFEDGPIDERVEAVRGARAAVRQRDQARRRARPREEVEAELTKLEARARREHRPEWGRDVKPADGDEPDVADLAQRRAASEQA